MIKIKNTNNYNEIIRCNGVEITIQPNMIMEVNEIVLSSLPKGVVKVNEEQMLCEIPYNNKEMIKDEIDISQLLMETI